MADFSSLEPLATVATAAATGLGVVSYTHLASSKAKEGCRGNPRDGERGLFKEAAAIGAVAAPRVLKNQYNYLGREKYYVSCLQFTENRKLC